MASIVKVDKIAQASGTPEFTIPTVDGTTGQFLKTDGSGVLSFDTVAAGVALTGSTNTWIPTITAANALTGTANFTYDGNTLDVKNSGTASSINLYCESSNAHYQKIKAAPHAGSSNWTLTLPPTVPTATGQALTATTAGVASWSGGNVLQVVSTTKTDVFTVTGTAFVDITGFAATITPVATTSKVLIFVSISCGTDKDTFVGFKMLRGATTVAEGDTNATAEEVTFGTVFVDLVTEKYRMMSLNYNFLDSPSTTSATTYKVQVSPMRTASRQFYLNRTFYIGDTNQMVSTSTITVMEIAG